MSHSPWFRTLCFAAFTPLWSSPLKLDYSGPQHNFNDRRGNPWSIQQLHVPSEDYFVGAEKWRVWLDPDPPEYHRTLPQQAIDVFNTRLPAASGWSYQYSNDELADNSLVVHWYEAVYEAPCYTGSAQCVGANFGIRYAATGIGDPPPSRTHWLQFVFNNHKNTGSHGDHDAKIDDLAGGIYYDNGAAANGAYLRDRPRRPDVNREHEWTAFLFLVDGPGIQPGFSVPPGEFTIWGGVEWGWKNACIENCSPVPELQSLLPVLAALAAGLLRQRRRRPSATVVS